MNMKLAIVALVLISVNELATVSLAQETDAKKDTKDMTLVDQKNSQTDAPTWMKYTIPGENHKALDAIAGKFTYKSKVWMDPKGKPIENSGTAETKWIMNGRYLQQDFEGKMGAKTFSGMALLGYDILKKEYQSVWLDSETTGMWISAGKGDTKSFETLGTGSDPMRNDTNRSFRTVTKIVSNNEYVYEMYSKGQDGKEYRSMEIRYKRAK